MNQIRTELKLRGLGHLMHRTANDYKQRLFHRKAYAAIVLRSVLSNAAV